MKTFVIAAMVCGTLLALAASLTLRDPRDHAFADSYPRSSTASRTAPGASTDAPAHARTSTAVGAPVTGSPSDNDFLTVQLATITPQLEAYGQVEPIALLPVNAAEAGVIGGLNVLPGARVRHGQMVAHLEGPQIDSLLRQGQADVRSARAQLRAARRTLEIERQQLTVHLSTQTAIQRAESALATAQTNFSNARSHLRAVRQMATLSAPADGTVLAVNASSGELVATGQTVLTLQPKGRLWIKATYYGSDQSQIRLGMKGKFVPSDGSAPIPIQVDAVAGTMTAGGGEALGLSPTISRVRWINGEFGTVTLDLSPRKLVVVPTRSLILSRGKWWVLVHSVHGDHPQEVVPGPSRGWQTFLESGIKPGTEIVVRNAYLLFHRGISQKYQPPY